MTVSTRPFTKKKKSPGAILSKIFFWLAIALIVLVVLAPFYWMIVSSISFQAELAMKPPHWFPQQPTFHRYLEILKGFTSGFSANSSAARFTRGLTNSFLVSLGTTAVCMAAGCMAAYALAKLYIPKSRGIMMAILSIQMLPAVVIIIPLNLLLQRLKMIDSIQGLILPYCGLMLPTVIWIMYGYFLTLPKEIEEAAMIDGCSRLRSFINVILPISGPALMTITAYTFLNSWNEFFMAMTLTQNQTKTITVTITEFASTFGSSDYGLLATGGVIGSIPPILIALLLQRYLVQGLTAGSVKG